MSPEPLGDISNSFSHTDSSLIAAVSYMFIGTRSSRDTGLLGPNKFEHMAESYVGEVSSTEKS